MSDIDALADTVRDTLPPRGVTSIPVKRTKSAVANAAHAALDDLVATAKAAEARVAELEGALGEMNLRVGTVLMALGFLKRGRTGFHAICERELTEADEIARAALASHDPELPLDLERVLRDPSIIVPQDQAVFEAVARWKNAPSDTASASPDPKEGEAA